VTSLTKQSDCKKMCSVDHTW